MYAKTRVGGFLDIWQNAQWPRFLGHPVYAICMHVRILNYDVMSKVRLRQWMHLSKGTLVRNFIPIRFETTEPYSLWLLKTVAPLGTTSEWRHGINSF